MNGYTLQTKTPTGEIEDIPLVATYDSAGNEITTTYAPIGHNHDSTYYTKTESDTLLNGKVSKTGNTIMKGNFTAYWLQSTSVTDLGQAAIKYAVFRHDGWIYYRTADEIKEDLGINNCAPLVHNHDGTYAPLEHSHDYAPLGHNHDGVYATPSDVSEAIATAITNTLNTSV